MEELKTRYEEKVLILNASWDYTTNQLSGKTGKTYKDEDFFQIHKPKRINYNSELPISTHFTNMKISWEHPKFGKMSVGIQLFDDPQQHNGIKFIGRTNKSIGLLIRNYKPKYMVIPSLDTQQYKKLHKRVKNSKNLFTKKAITNKKKEIIEYY